MAFDSTFNRLEFDNCTTLISKRKIGVHSDKVRYRINKGKTINEIYKLYNNGKSYFSNNSKDSILIN